MHFIRIYKIIVECRLQEVKIIMIGKESSQESVPQSNGSQEDAVWVELGIKKLSGWNLGI